MNNDRVNINNNLSPREDCFCGNKICGISIFNKLFTRKINSKAPAISEKEYILNVFLLYLMPIIFLVIGVILVDAIYSPHNFVLIFVAIFSFIFGTFIAIISNKLLQHNQKGQHNQ